MNNIFAKIEASFKSALQGKETINILVYYWGIIGYIVAFISNKLIRSVHIYIFGVTIAAILIAYFSWHIYALKKCSPKKPQLTKGEKKKLREERRKELPKKIMRKFFLQESIGKWDPVFVSIIVDAFYIAQFVDYIVR